MATKLRSALVVNATFSLISGLTLAAVPATVGNWLGVNVDQWLRLLGVVLVGHAVLIATLMPRLELRRVATLNLLAIAPYPFLMVLLVGAGWVERPLGQGLVLIDGLIIGVLAIVHALGLKAMSSQPTHQLS